MRAASSSNLVSEIAAHAPDERLSFAWLLERLEQDSIGIVVLFAAIIGMAPGVSILAGALLAVLALQMMLGYERVLLPRFIAEWSFPARRITHVMSDTERLLRHVERHRCTDRPLPRLVRRLTGVPILLLSVTLFVPLPFSNVVPAAMIGALAIAWLADNGLLLAAGVLGCAASLAITATMVTAIVGAGRLIF